MSQAAPDPEHPAIQLEAVSKHYADGRGGGHAALEQVDLAVESGETLALVGSSGSGKTTLLRLINRLEEPSSGRVWVDGSDVADADPVALRRCIGYVIQSGGLFPHLTVEENIGLLCRLVGWTEERIRERVRSLLDLVQLASKEFARRYPAQLSGGQAQRVGVARALALDPRIVLLDEPFGALDPVTRAALQTEFCELQSRLNKTLVLVTHDMREAFLLADRVAFLSHGRILQVGVRADFEERPASDEVVRFMASMQHV